MLNAVTIMYEDAPTEESVQGVFDQGRAWVKDHPAIGPSGQLTAAIATYLAGALYESASGDLPTALLMAIGNAELTMDMIQNEARDEEERARKAGGQ